MNDRRVQYDAVRMGLSFSELESRLTPIGRRLEPDEIAPMAVLLASEESAAITGQAFNIWWGELLLERVQLLNSPNELSTCPGCGSLLGLLLRNA